MKNLDEHKEEIIKRLELNKNIPVLYGEEAEKFFDNYSGLKRNKGSNGAFLCKNLLPEYKDTGVICMFRENVGTLAHELMHAKQWQSGYFWIQKGRILELIYKFILYTQLFYYYYPAEFYAFNFALNYLKEAKVKEPQLEEVYKAYKWEVRLKQWPLPILVLLFFSGLWYCLS